jgi:diguanylate cyclase (GGDEF)-like protein
MPMLDDPGRLEALYRTLAGNMPSGAVTVVDPELRVAFAEGPALATLLGLPRAQILGRSLLKLTMPANRERMLALITAALAGQEQRDELKHGSRSFAVRLVPVRDGRGEVFAAMVLSFDISLQKLAQTEVARQTSLVELLTIAASASNAGTSTEAAFATVLEAVCRHASWPAGHVYRMVDGVLRPTGLWYGAEGPLAWPLREATSRTSYQVGEGLPGRVLAESRAIWLDTLDATAWSRRNEPSRAAGFTGTAGFPVRIGDEVEAVLEFFFTSDARPSVEFLGVMDGVGVQLGRMVERELAARKLEALSIHDDLTGLYNRRGFHTLAEPQLRIAGRAMRMAALLFIDVDNLKPVNDALGHDVGDQLLVDVADSLRGVFRASDLIARIGGDEFVVLTGDDEIIDPDTLRRRIDLAFSMTPAGRPYAIRVSVGLAIFDPGAPRSLDELLHAGDLDMYARKRVRRASQGG